MGCDDFFFAWEGARAVDRNRPGQHLVYQRPLLRRTENMREPDCQSRCIIVEKSRQAVLISGWTNHRPASRALSAWLVAAPLSTCSGTGLLSWCSGIDCNWSATSRLGTKCRLLHIGWYRRLNEVAQRACLADAFFLGVKSKPELFNESRHRSVGRG